MKLSQCFATIVLFATALPAVFGNNDNNNNDDGMFAFTDNTDYSNSAIYPMSCIETNNGDAVVFQMFNKGHNQCKKKSAGIYKTSIQIFVKAYIKQVQAEYEAKGAEYEVDDDALEYLTCQQYYYNNNMYYMKVGCRNTGKGFQVHTYTDMYCSTKSTTSGYNSGVDVSSLRVSFETCKSCVATSSSYGYNKYNNNNNNNNNNNKNYNYNSYYENSSPLCSAATNYKETCNGSCRRSAKKNGSSTSRGYTGEGFSPVGKFFLWILSLSAIFFLLAGLAQRKKMSKQDALIEEAAIKSSGVDKKYIPRIFVGLILFIVLLILVKKKILTWFFLVTVNVALLAYWMHLKNKAEQNAAVSGFQLYGEGGAVA